MSKGLKYTGNGNFLAGIPARDLSPEEVEEFGAKALLRSGLYVQHPSTNKLQRPGSMNKEVDNAGDQGSSETSAGS